MNLATHDNIAMTYIDVHNMICEAQFHSYAPFF